jgi:predicted lipoprotein with Yx(FWY)xxD motif
MGIGTVLTDGKGFTLYHLTSDSNSTTTCVGGCASTWPPFITKNGAVPALKGLKGKFGTLQ